MKLSQVELNELERICTKNGYRKYTGHANQEDYGFWKAFYEQGDKEKADYQIAFLIYDFSVYEKYEPKELPYGVTVAIYIHTGKFSRVDVIITDDELFNLDQIETYAKNLYNFNKK